MSVRVRVSCIAGLLLIGSLTATAADAACCRASCIGAVPWLACFADTTSCSTLMCIGASTSLAVDATATCGVGPIFGACPPTEVGACTDNINNDGWVDAVTDAADPDCAAASAPAGVPTLGVVGLTAVVALLLAVAALRFRRG